MNRLQYFLTTDDTSRQKAALIAAVSGFVIGPLLQWSGEPFDVAAYCAVVVVFVVFCWQVRLYCHGEKKLLSKSPFTKRRLLKLAVAATVLFLVIAIPTPTLEAGAVDRSLRAQISGQTLSSANAEKISNALDVARQWEVTVPPNTLVKVRDSIKASALEARDTNSLPSAVNALANYGRAITKRDLERYSQFRAEYLAGLDHGVAAMRDPTLTEAETAKALSAFTRAIELADDNRRLKSDALMARALLYEMMRRQGDALADAEAAESLGALDLPMIFLIEGSALAQHQNNAIDLERAVRLLTIANKGEPLFGDSRDYHFIVLVSLFLAYSNLGQPQKACEYTEPALALLPPGKIRSGQARIAGDIYRRATICHLQSGNYAEALKTATDYAARLGTGEAVHWRDIVEWYPQDPQTAMGMLMRWQ